MKLQAEHVLSFTVVGHACALLITSNACKLLFSIIFIDPQAALALIVSLRPAMAIPVAREHTRVEVLAELGTEKCSKVRAAEVGVANRNTRCISMKPVLSNSPNNLVTPYSLYYSHVTVTSDTLTHKGLAVLP